MAERVTDKSEGERETHETILSRNSAEHSGTLDDKGECVFG